jgi:very-short-patch-repair endonuclease
VTTRALDRLIASLAERQHGVVEHGQLIALGATPREIDHRLRRGSLHALHRGVYAVGHPVVSQRGRWIAAVLAAGPEALLSHRAAAALWGIRQSRALEVTAGRRVRRPGIVVHRRAIAADERAVVDGIPVTSAARTLLDLAAILPRGPLERAIHEAEVRRLGGPLSLDDLLARHPGRRGTRALREILATRSLGLNVPRNDFEQLFVTALERAGLPRPEVNARLEVAGRAFEVDALWREHRVVVELDGRETHDTTDRFHTDRERDRILAAAGWRTARVTHRHLTTDERGVTADVAAILGAPAVAGVRRRAPAR